MRSYIRDRTLLLLLIACINESSSLFYSIQRFHLLIHEVNWLLDEALPSRTPGPSASVLGGRCTSRIILANDFQVVAIDAVRLDVIAGFR